MTLAERSARSGIGIPAVPIASPEPESTPESGSVTESVPVMDSARPGRGSPGGRHCWVVDAPASPGRWPGVLVEWRRRPGGGWAGRVVWVVWDEDGPVVIESWLDAGLLAES